METIKRLIDKKILKCSYNDYEEIALTCCLNGYEKDLHAAALYDFLLDKDILFFSRFTKDRLDSVNEIISIYNGDTGIRKKSPEFNDTLRLIPNKYLLHTAAVSLHKPFLKDFSEIKSTEVYKRFAKEKRLGVFFNLLLAGFFFNQDVLDNMIKFDIVLDPFCAMMSRVFEEKYSSFRKYSIFMQTHLDNNITYDLSFEDLYENGIVTISFISNASQFCKFYNSNFKINIVKDENHFIYLNKIKELYLEIKNFIYSKKSFLDPAKFGSVLGCFLGGLFILDKEIIKDIFSYYSFDDESIDVFFDGFIFGVSEDEFSIYPDESKILNKRLQISNVYISLVEEKYIVKAHRAYNPILLILKGLKRNTLIEESNGISVEFYYKWYDYFIVPALSLTDKEIEDEDSDGYPIGGLDAIFSFNWLILRNNLRNKDKAFFFTNLRRLKNTAFASHMKYFFPKFLETDTEKKRYLQRNLKNRTLNISCQDFSVPRHFYFNPSFSYKATAAIKDMTRREEEELVSMMTPYDLYENRMNFNKSTIARYGSLDKKIIKFLITRTWPADREEIARIIIGNLMYNKKENFLELLKYLSDECKSYQISILKHVLDKKFFTRTNAYQESNYVIIDRVTDRVCSLEECLSWSAMIKGVIKND